MNNSEDFLHSGMDNKKIGAPPGTVIYSGEERNERVKLTLIEFSETEFFVNFAARAIREK